MQIFKWRFGLFFSLISKFMFCTFTVTFFWSSQAPVVSAPPQDCQDSLGDFNFKQTQEFQHKTHRREIYESRRGLKIEFRFLNKRICHKVKDKRTNKVLRLWNSASILRWAPDYLQNALLFCQPLWSFICLHSGPLNSFPEITCHLCHVWFKFKKPDCAHVWI